MKSKKRLSCKTICVGTDSVAAARCPYWKHRDIRPPHGQSTVKIPTYVMYRR
ncbi:unnamed protein product [Ixodes pacificus]